MVNAMRNKRTIVCGVGINDADYVVNSKVNGKIVRCQFHQTWADMIRRCCDENYQSRHPAYAGCVVSAEWFSFMAFKSWMQTQDWRGKALDKDLLFVGNKVYSPKNCVFVDSITNNFTLDHAAARGAHPLGVYFAKRNKKFIARCSNPFTKKVEVLGYFACSETAHQAWKKRKNELALQLADLQTDERVAQALRVRYL